MGEVFIRRKSKMYAFFTTNGSLSGQSWPVGFMFDTLGVFFLAQFLP